MNDEKVWAALALYELAAELRFTRQELAAARIELEKTRGGGGASQAGLTPVDEAGSTPAPATNGHGGDS